MNSPPAAPVVGSESPDIWTVVPPREDWEASEYDAGADGDRGWGHDWWERDSRAWGRYGSQGEAAGMNGSHDRGQERAGADIRTK